MTSPTRCSPLTGQHRPLMSRLTSTPPGMNVGMYMREDGTYVATGGPMPGEASLTVSAMPNATSEAAAYMYQLARLDAARVPGMW